jgi:hypothetical protein
MTAAKSICAFKDCWRPEVSEVKCCIRVLIYRKQTLRTLMHILLSVLRIPYLLISYWMQEVFDLNRCV